MILLRRHALLRSLASLAALPLLAACENSATSMMLESKDHSLVLIRQQQYFWGDVKQYIVASRLPVCQHRVEIHPDTAAMNTMTVYEAGSMLWALHQGNRWYLASTEECQVQDWNNSSSTPPGPAVGSFGQHNGKTVFTPAAK